MLTLRTDRARPRTFCAACQVGQGRNCACRKRRPSLSTSELIVLICIASVTVSVMTFGLLVEAARAWL